MVFSTCGLLMVFVALCIIMDLQFPEAGLPLQDLSFWGVQDFRVLQRSLFCSST